jgi:hypothetical protein
MDKRKAAKFLAALRVDFLLETGQKNEFVTVPVDAVNPGAFDVGKFFAN